MAAKPGKKGGIAHKHVILKPTYRVENIVASADMQLDLDLYGLAKLSHDVDYEPEQFPGAIFKVHDPKAALLLFKNGKIICTGTRTATDAKRAVSLAVELVKRYKVANKGKPPSMLPQRAK
jgi:transcription initiation factor TFIID TATA-box-binding protein